MKAPDMVGLVKKAGHFAEAYHVTRFQCYCDTNDGGARVIWVDILDAGPDVEYPRYSVHATSDDGKWHAVGTPAERIELALALVDWGDLGAVSMRSRTDGTHLGDHT